MSTLMGEREVSSPLSVESTPSGAPPEPGAGGGAGAGDGAGGGGAGAGAAVTRRWRVDGLEKKRNSNAVTTICELNETYRETLKL